MADQARVLASSFAIDKWQKAFAGIDDESETLVAGMASWVRVTTNKKTAERVYYMVTAAGLHVGQPAPGGFLGGGAVDYFLPRNLIVGSDSDQQGALDFHLGDGTKVIMSFADIFPQLGEHHMQERPAGAQAQSVAAALGWPH